MRAVNHPFHHRSKFGLYCEKVLQPTIESILGETIVKTSDTMDTMDFVSKSYVIELKSRSDCYHFSQSFIKKGGWVLPTCKLRRAIEETTKGKKVVFFYFWMAGKTLWKWEFKMDDLQDIQSCYPEWHLDKQEQSFVKEHHWTQVASYSRLL